MALVEDVARQLQAVRGDRSYAELARQTEMDDGYLYRIFTGSRNVTLTTLEKVADACDCAVTIQLVPKAVE